MNCHSNRQATKRKLSFRPKPERMRRRSGGTCFFSPARCGGGRFYRPLKQAVSMRLDADVIAWLKKQGKGYQTRANSILRQRMLDELRRA
jgi:uncharacterized protein (DUF4415 family)